MWELNNWQRETLVRSSICSHSFNAQEHGGHVFSGRLHAIIKEKPPGWLHDPAIKESLIGLQDDIHDFIEKLQLC